VARSPVDGGQGHLERVARGGFFNLAGSVVSAVVALAFTIFITRGLDKPTAGVFFALTSMYTLAFSVARLGVPTGLVYFLARFRAQRKGELLRPVCIAAAIPVVLLSLLMCAVGLGWSDELAQVLVHRDDESTVALVQLLSIFILWGALNDLGVGATRGYGVMRPLVVVDRVARPVAQLVLIAAVVLAGTQSASVVGFAWVLPYLPSALAVWWWAERLRRRTIRRLAAQDAAGEPEEPAQLESPMDSAALAAAGDRDVPTARGQFLAFWRFTLPRTIGSIAQMVLQRADVVLIGILRGPAEAAVYAAATRFLVFGQLGGGAISTTIQPKISALMAKGDRGGARLVYRTATVWLILLTWPIYLLFCVFSTDLLRVFGSSYTVGAPVIVVLSLTMLVATACGAVDVVLVMAGRSSWTMANAIVALAVNLVLNLLLIPPFGIMGAAVAWAVAILINNLAPLTELALWMRLHPFGRATLVATLVCAVSFGLIPLLVRLVFGHSLVWEIAAAAFGSLIYLAGVWRWRELLELRALLAIRKTRRVEA
jgi:O-antigen/teichoic acid export membrane protein